MFQQRLLLVDGWRVSAVDYVAQARQMLIRVEELPALWQTQTCPHCNAKSVAVYDHAPERRWPRLNVCQLECIRPANPSMRSEQGLADWAG